MRFGASAVLVESTIADCQTRDSRGGGAHVEQANLTLQGDSRVERCLADWGGGLSAFEADIALLQGSVLSECRASFGGGLCAARCTRGARRAHAHGGGSMPHETGTGPPECIELALAWRVPSYSRARCPWP